MWFPFKFAGATISDLLNTDPSGISFVLMIIVIAMLAVFCIPIFRYIYIRFIKAVVLKGIKKARELSQRLSDRVSDAGRKLSDRAAKL